jgi:hypothetical protein
MDALLASLRDTGLTETEKVSVLLLVSGYVRNEATLSADIDAAFQAAGATADEAMSGYGRLLRRLTDAERFPALHEAVTAGVFDQADHPDAEFTFGLDRVLDGIEALVRSRTA